MFIAVYSYFKLIAHKKLNISWTVLQFNIIIPILVSLLFFGERLHTITIIGCIFMILAIFSFGYGKNKKLGPPSNLDKSLSRLLFLASVFSGLAVSFPKFYSAGSNVSRPFLLMLISSGTMVILSFLFSIVNRNSYPTEKSIGNHWPTRAISIPLVMGFFQLASMITLTISLEAIQGAIAYPIRSLSSLLTVYIFAFILFRESFHNSEKLGVIFSMVAIGFISYAL
jgi:drug/metabolite transporter (DMT)-like permease